MRKGWVEEKISLIVQNAFTPKETEDIAREVKRQDKKKKKHNRFRWIFSGDVHKFPKSRGALE